MNAVVKYLITFNPEPSIQQNSEVSFLVVLFFSVTFYSTLKLQSLLLSFSAKTSEETLT